MTADLYVKLGSLVIIAVFVAGIVLYHMMTLPRRPASEEREAAPGRREKALSGKR